MRGRLLGVLCVLVLAFNSAQAQILTAPKHARTVSVEATGKVEADAELAVIRIAYSNYGPTEADAYEENTEAGNKIVHALIEAGLPEKNIETYEVSLEAVYDEDWPEEWKEQRKYEARQAWSLRVPAEAAQAAVDAAMAAGANELVGVMWQVSDERALEAKAYADADALAKARSLALQMVDGFKVKLGVLVSASNMSGLIHQPSCGLTAPRSAYTEQFWMRRERPSLRLFPQKVRKETTVYATFAIE